MPPSRENKENPDPPGPEDPEEFSSEEIRGFLPDLVRRGLTLGFTGLFLTEEAMRKALGDTVPREWLEFVISQSDRTRQDLVERMSREMGKVLSALDPVEVLRRLFEGQTLEVTAKIHFPDARKEDPKEAPESASDEKAPPKPGSGASVRLRSREKAEADSE